MWWFSMNNMVSALTLGLDVLYVLFIISLSFTPTEFIWQQRRIVWKGLVNIAGKLAKIYHEVSKVYVWKQNE